MNYQARDVLQMITRKDHHSVLGRRFLERLINQSMKHFAIREPDILPELRGLLLFYDDMMPRSMVYQRLVFEDPEDGNGELPDDPQPAPAPNILRVMQASNLR